MSKSRKRRTMFYKVWITLAGVFAVADAWRGIWVAAAMMLMAVIMLSLSLGMRDELDRTEELRKKY